MSTERQLLVDCLQRLSQLIYHPQMVLPVFTLQMET
jgi:hypothetical protein